KGNRSVRTDSDASDRIAARSPTLPMLPHSRAARNKDMARAPNAFAQHRAAVVSRLGEQLQPMQAGLEYDLRALRRAFRAPMQAGSKRRKMRGRASPPHPEVQLLSVCLVGQSR